MSKDFFNKIYEQHYNLIKRIVISQLIKNSEEDIYSCINDTFMAAYTDIKNDLENNPSLSGWLVKTASNFAHRYNRNNLTITKYQTHLSDRITGGESEDDTPEKIPETAIEKDFTETIDDDDKFNRLMELGIIEKILSRLTPAEREFYELKYVRKLSDKEITDETGMENSLIRVKNFRLKKKLKKIVTQV